MLTWIHGASLRQRRARASVEQGANFDQGPDIGSDRWWREIGVYIGRPSLLPGIADVVLTVPAIIP